MLGKTAGGLYWMFRYLERSENITRMIDVGLRISLTRPDNAQDEWASIMDSAGVRSIYEETHDKVNAASVIDFLLRDPDNPSSVMSCIGSARMNARLVRTALTREVWEATNECWLRLKDVLAEPVAARELPEVLGIIRQQSALVRAALHGTMLRNEIYNFSRIGTFIERADNTARILDVKYYVLLPTANHVGSSLDNVQWETILRSASGFRSYRMNYGPDITPRGIAEFLIFDRQMPRSLAFCYSKIGENLGYLEEGRAERLPSNDVHDIFRRDFETQSVDTIFDLGLHTFLRGFEAYNSRLGSQIEQDYRFHS
jgi:uncharacterized alpha-E superfamily protein